MAHEIFRETFAKHPAENGWQVDLSDDNACTISPDGVLKFEANQNTFAHLQRQITEDCLRTEVMLKPDMSASWANGIVYYWDPQNWLRVMIYEGNDGLGVGIWLGGTGGGYIWTELMVDGQLHRQRLSACYARRWHHIGLELAEDCIRYPVSQDGQNWINMAILRRPASWIGKRPESVIIGKGYCAPEYPNPDFNNDYSDSGERNESLYKSIVIHAVPETSRRLTEFEEQVLSDPLRDWLGEMEIASSKGPTFESVSSHLPGMLFSRELLGIKNHPQYIGVAFDGALELNRIATTDYYKPGGVPAGIWEVGAEQNRLGWKTGSCQKTLKDGWKPIILCRYVSSPVEPDILEDPDIEYRQTLLGYADDFSHENEMFAYCRLDVFNHADIEKKVPVQFRFFPTEHLFHWDLAIPPKKSAEICIKIPFSAIVASTSEIPGDEFNAILDRVSRYWDEQYATAMKLHSPETRVNETFLAWDMWNMLNIRRNGDTYNVYDGAGFYESWFGFSAADHILGHDYMGHHEDARLFLETALKNVNEEGEWKTNFGLPDTPALLRSLVAHYRLTGDAEWLKDVSPTMIRMCRWIMQLRERSLEQPQSELVHGLINARPYADHGSPSYSYLSDSILCVGMEETAAAFKEIGLDEIAESIATAAAGYRSDILKSMKKSIHEHEGRKYMPMFPETSELLHQSGYRADDYYGLVAGMLLANGFLADEPELSEILVETIEQRNGLLLGCLVFRGGIDHAYLHGYLEEVLRRNEPEKAVLGLYGWMAFGNTRGTYSGVEMTNHFTGDNHPSLPHGYSHAVQTILIRKMLLRESGNSLFLAQAVPRHWNAPGQKVELMKAPSFFGETGYVTKMDDHGNTMTVRIDYPDRKTDCRILFFARHPERKTIHSVTADGKPFDQFEDDRVILHPAARPRELIIRFE